MCFYEITFCLYVRKLLNSVKTKAHLLFPKMPDLTNSEALQSSLIAVSFYEKSSIGWTYFQLSTHSIALFLFVWILSDSPSFYFIFFISKVHHCSSCIATTIGSSYFKQKQNGFTWKNNKWSKFKRLNLNERNFASIVSFCSMFHQIANSTSNRNFIPLFHNPHQFSSTYTVNMP